MQKATKKYTIAYTYKGIGIYTLEVADPTKDSLGYVVDSKYVEGEFSTIGEAIEAINKVQELI